MDAEVQIFAHRNGETTLPELSPNEFSYYWFDGTARYEEWHQRGNLVVVTGEKKDRVIGLVVVAMMIDMKRPVKSPNGDYVHNRATMIAELETMGYDLDKCEGRFWGPQYIPPISQDMYPRFAATMDWETWTRFHGESQA